MDVLSREEWPTKYGPRTDITGQRFGKWLVLGLTRRCSERKKWFWAVACQDCPWETVTESRAQDLLRGKTVSCRHCHIAKNNTRHGDSQEPFYRVWKTMIARCSSPSDSGYQYYGARGIRVCDRWLKYENFRDDMRAGYQPGLEIDRVDNDGPYSPDNCRWATHQEQMNHTRRSFLIRWGDRTMTMSAWSRETGINLGTLRYRVVDMKWPLRRALTEGATLGTPLEDGDPEIVSR